jgi:hypothetical protein
MTKSTDGVHRTHCCVYHGCKYNEGSCPVYDGRLQQDYSCEECEYDPLLRVIEEIDKRISKTSCHNEDTFAELVNLKMFVIAEARGDHADAWLRSSTKS